MRTITHPATARVRSIEASRTRRRWQGGCRRRRWCWSSAARDGYTRRYVGNTAHQSAILASAGLRRRENGDRVAVGREWAGCVGTALSGVGGRGDREQRQSCRAADASFAQDALLGFFVVNGAMRR